MKFIKNTLSMTRSIIFDIIFALWLTISHIVLSPLAINPNFIRYIHTIWSRGLLFLLKLICNISYKAEGLENIPKDKPCIFIGKHQSIWETSALLSILDSPHFVIKKELTRIPIYRWYLKSSGMIIVDRNPFVRSAGLIKMLKEVTNRVKNKRNIIIFPEGTRTSFKKDIPFSEYKLGIMSLWGRVDAHFVPFSLNSGVFWPKGKFKIKTPGKIEIKFHKPIDPLVSKKDAMNIVYEKVEIDSRRMCQKYRVGEDKK